jgi:hypothetical protein
MQTDSVKRKRKNTENRAKYHRIAQIAVHLMENMLYFIEKDICPFPDASIDIK